MINIITEENRHLFYHALTDMHRHRKQVFMDRMGWRLHELAGLEMDAFDRKSSVYLIETADDGAVMQSARLLPTLRPHLLGEVFDNLCVGGAPRSETIWEASRFCPAPNIKDRTQRRAMLMRMIAAVMETCILFDVTATTFVVGVSLAPLAEEAGWDVKPLGPPRRYGKERLVAMRAEITPEGLARVRTLHGLSGPVTPNAIPNVRRAA